MRDMERSDLKSGMVFEIARGWRYLVVTKDTAINERGYLDLNMYHEDLTRDDERFSIKKVFCVQDGYNCRIDKLSEAKNLLWEEKCYV